MSTRTATICLDASPLIFLAKLGRLQLLADLALGRCLVPEAVKAELLVPGVAPELQPGLQQFLEGCDSVAVENPPAFSSALSHADRCVLALAITRQAALVVADDLPLRKLLVLHRLRPLGTLGLLLLAAKRGLLPPSAAQESLQLLVTRHQFRVSVEVYADFQRRVRLLAEESRT